MGGWVDLLGGCVTMERLLFLIRDGMRDSVGIFWLGLLVPIERFFFGQTNLQNRPILLHFEELVKGRYAGAPTNSYLHT